MLIVQLTDPGSWTYGAKNWGAVMWLLDRDTCPWGPEEASVTKPPVCTSYQWCMGHRHLPGFQATYNLINPTAGWRKRVGLLISKHSFLWTSLPTLSIKDQRVNILGFSSHTVSVSGIQLWWYIKKQAAIEYKYINEHGCVTIKLY